MTRRELPVFSWLQEREGTSLGDPKYLAVWPSRLCEQVIVTLDCPWSRRSDWSVPDRALEGALQEGPRGAAGKKRGLVGGA